MTSPARCIVFLTMLAAGGPLDARVERTTVVRLGGPARSSP